MQDVPSTGCHFTWNSKVVSSKIDWIMVNSAWLEENLFWRSEFLTRGTKSNHSACIATLFAKVPTFKREFKFCNAWMDHPTFHQTLKDYWDSTTITGGEQEKLSLKFSNSVLSLENSTNHISTIYLSRLKLLVDAFTVRNKIVTGIPSIGIYEKWRLKLECCPRNWMMWNKIF